jgi:hypothetical protein
MFIVEDGTGVEDANSYVTVEYANTYFSTRNNLSWKGEDSEKESFLILATDYIDARFGALFIGQRTTSTQALEWPRVVKNHYTGASVSTYPKKLLRACCEYAVRAINAALMPDLNIDSSGMILVQTTKNLNPLQAGYQVVSRGLGSTSLLYRPYPAADILLRELLIRTNRVYR